MMLFFRALKTLSENCWFQHFRMALWIFWRRKQYGVWRNLIVLWCHFTLSQCLLEVVEIKVPQLSWKGLLADCMPNKKFLSISLVKLGPRLCWQQTDNTTIYLDLARFSAPPWGWSWTSWAAHSGWCRRRRTASRSASDGSWWSGWRPLGARGHRSRSHALHTASHTGPVMNIVQTFFYTFWSDYESSFWKIFLMWQENIT